MLPFRVRLRGTGSVEVAAYGVGDAEHRVEKELATRLPDMRVEVREIRRPEHARIVEEFAVAYVVRGALVVQEERSEDARRAAFREARGRLAGSRYERTAWEAEGVEALE